MKPGSTYYLDLIIENTAILAIFKKIPNFNTKTNNDRKLAIHYCKFLHIYIRNLQYSESFKLASLKLFFSP